MDDTSACDGSLWSIQSRVTDNAHHDKMAQQRRDQKKSPSACIDWELLPTILVPRGLPPRHFAGAERRTPKGRKTRHTHLHSPIACPRAFPSLKEISIPHTKKSHALKTPTLGQNTLMCEPLRDSRSHRQAPSGTHCDVTPPGRGLTDIRMSCFTCAPKKSELLLRFLRPLSQPIHCRLIHRSFSLLFATAQSNWLTQPIRWLLWLCLIMRCVSPRCRNAATGARKAPRASAKPARVQ